MARPLLLKCSRHILERWELGSVWMMFRPIDEQRYYYRCVGIVLVRTDSFVGPGFRTVAKRHALEANDRHLVGNCHNISDAIAPLG